MLYLQIGYNLPLVYCITLEHVVFQDLIRPTTKSHTTY